MIYADIVNAVLSLCLILAFFVFPSIILVFVITFFQAIASSVFVPARTKLLGYNLTSSDERVLGYSFAQTAVSVAYMIGAALTGVLISVKLDFQLLFVIGAMTFVLSALFIQRVNFQFSLLDVKRESLLSAIQHGIKFIIKDRILVGITLFGCGIICGVSMFNALHIPFILNDLKIPIELIGITEAAQIAGITVAATSIFAFLGKMKPKYNLLIGSVLFGTSISLMPLSQNIYHYLIFIFLFGLAEIPYGSSLSAVIQSRVTNEIRARVTTTINTVLLSMDALVSAISGYFAGIYGYKTIFLVGGLLTLIIPVVVYLIFLLPNSQKSNADIA